MEARPTHSKCKSCGAPCFWAKTAKGTAMLVDVEASPDGTVELQRQGGGFRAVIRIRLDKPEGVPLHRSHFATCPDAAAWRRNRSTSRKR